MSRRASAATSIRTGQAKPSRTSAPNRARSLRPPLVVVGFGRLGGALALQLSREGWPVSISAESASSIQAARRAGLALATTDELRAAAIALIAVRDDAVHARTQALLRQLGEKTALVHCAGALPLRVFGDGADVLTHPRGSFHPLAAVSSPHSALAGKSVALSGTTVRLTTLLRRMAKDLSLRPFEVNEERRAAYHAGAVLSAGGAVALLSTAVQAFGLAGVKEEDAVRALLPLMRSALDGVEARGLSGGLTGPIPRGDVGVVRAHLEALSPPLRAIYRELSEEMLALTELPTPQQASLKRALRETAPRKSSATPVPRRR